MEILEKTSKLSALAANLQSTYHKEIPYSFRKRAQGAAEILHNLEFPSTKQEYWKYTRTGLIANKSWQFAEALDLNQLPIDIEEFDFRMVFVNGAFAGRLSKLPAKHAVHISPFHNMKTERSELFDTYNDDLKNPFIALNAAMPQDGYDIEIAEGTTVEHPIYIVNIYTGDQTISQPRNYIHLNRGSSLKLTEYHFHLGEGSTFTNSATEIWLQDNSNLGMDIVQKGSTQSFHQSQMDAIMHRDSQLTVNTFTMDGKWTRNNSGVRVKGENCTANLNGFYIPSENQHVDNHTIIDHESANCDSNELYRGVLLDQSTGVFNGKVYVREDAQKTNAFQSNGNILVHDTATVNSKPELEIYADDVKCSHGSTTGQLDDEALFYLRARGLSESSARKMLVAAFAENVLEKLVNPSLRDQIEQAIAAKLSK